VSTREAEERILDGRVWTDFCERLKQTGRFVRAPGVPTDLMNRALGYRFLTRILRAGLERFVDYADPEYPAFYIIADDTKKILNDNPETSSRLARSTAASTIGSRAVAERSIGPASASRAAWAWIPWRASRRSILEAADRAGRVPCDTWRARSTSVCSGRGHTKRRRPTG
jgi:hypothetical protein